MSQNEAVLLVVTSLYLSSGLQGQDLGEQAFELNKINNKHATFETQVQNFLYLSTSKIKSTAFDIAIFWQK